MRSVPLKEDLTTEFKSDVKRYPDGELIDEIVSMANTMGGFLYLGVEDNGDISGVHEKHEDTIGLTALIANNTVPSLSVRADILNEEGKNVLCIEVPKSRTVVSTSAGKMLRRRLKADGTPETVPMYSYEIVTRLSQLGLLDYSSGPLAGATIDDLDPNERIRLRNYIQNTPGGEKNLLGLQDDELDRALHIVTDVNGISYPTLTGILLIGKEYRIKELVPTHRSSFQVLEGTKIRVNLESCAPVLKLVETFETYMDAWNPEREMEIGFKRTPIPEFDKAAYREGLINAFCHRDYTVLGSVRVLIDDDGLTINSPGGFIEGVTMDNLLTVEPHGKNPALTDALKRIGLAEKTGRGIDRIYEGSILYGRAWPDYSESTGNNVRLYIPRCKADESFIEFISDLKNKTNRSLSIYALMILYVLRKEGNTSFQRLMNIIHLSQARLRSNLSLLISEDIVVEDGFGDYCVYRLKNEVCDSNGWYSYKEVSYAEIILNFAKNHNGTVTKQDVAKLLKLTKEQAYSEIKKLVAQGKLYRYCGGKYTKYCLSGDLRSI